MLTKLHSGQKAIGMYVKSAERLIQHSMDNELKLKPFTNFDTNKLEGKN